MASKRKKIVAPKGWLTLSAWCYRERLDFSNGYRLVLTGKVWGRKIGRHWYVIATSKRTRRGAAPDGGDVKGGSRDQS